MKTKEEELSDAELAMQRLELRLIKAKDAYDRVDEELKTLYSLLSKASNNARDLHRLLDGKPVVREFIQ